MLQHINDQSKPLIFLGSNSNINQYKEVCDEHQIQVHGIIDSEYYGDTDYINGIPVIDNEKGLLSKIDFYRDFNFFCATNWSPMVENHGLHNLEKRKNHIKLLQNIAVDVITLIDSKSKVSTSATVGKGCFVDAFVTIEPNCVIEDYVNIYNRSTIGHHTQIGINSVIQRGAGLAADLTVGENCYFGIGACALKHGANFGDGTFIHEGMYIRRGTVPDEIIGIHSTNKNRVYSRYIPIELLGE